MGRTYRKTEEVSCTNGCHRREFGCRALRISQMVLANFLADRDHDALPADHGAEAESQSDCDLDPKWDEAGRAVNVGFVVLEHGDVGGGELWLAALLHDA